MINIDLIAKNSKLAFKVVVLCYGNPSRGDDALAPLLYEHLVELFSMREDLLLVNDFQLQIEHIVDISQADLVLFIDAHSDCVTPLNLLHCKLVISLVTPLMRYHHRIYSVFTSNL